MVEMREENAKGAIFGGRRSGRRAKEADREKINRTSIGEASADNCQCNGGDSGFSCSQNS